MSVRIERLLAALLLVSRSLFAEPFAPREHFGTAATLRLLSSDDPNETEIGLLRARAAPDPDAMAAVAKTIGRGGAARRDGRLLIEAARTLSAHSELDVASGALLSLLREKPDSILPATAAAAREQVDFALEIAAWGLVRERAPHLLEAVALLAEENEEREPVVRRALERASARRNERGEETPLPERLLLHPHLAAFAAAAGDARALGPVSRAAKEAHHPAQHAALVSAWSRSRDPAAVAYAETLLSNPSPVVRVAATKALVEHHADSAAPAVVSLMTDPGSRIDGIGLASDIADSRVAEGLIALLKVTSDDTARCLAAAALAEQPGEEAAQALLPLTSDPHLFHCIASALAHSKSAESLRRIEALPTAGGGQRVVARAYASQKLLYGVRSGRLEALLRNLAPSDSPASRPLPGGAAIAARPDAETKTPRVIELVEAVRRGGNPRERRVGLFGLARYRGRAVEEELFLEAEKIDPDESVRALAKSIRLGGKPPTCRARVVWVSVREAAPERGETARRGAIVLEDGPEVPFVVESDGVALVEVCTTGEPRVVLAP